MKKRLNILLVAALICSMTFTMTACSDDKETVSDITVSESDKNATDDTTKEDTDLSEDADTDNSNAEEGESVFPAALSDVETIPVPDLTYTGWALSGGMVDGKEMEEADVQSILDACGGCFNFIFNEEGTVTMENGEQSFAGTYTVTLDGYAIDIVFENYEYYGVFTTIDDLAVMILANKTDSETAFYLTTLEEG